MTVQLKSLICPTPDLRCRPMPKWDGLKPLPDHVVAPLLRALISIPRRPESRLILQPVKEGACRFGRRRATTRDVARLRAQATLDQIREDVRL